MTRSIHLVLVAAAFVACSRTTEPPAPIGSPRPNQPSAEDVSGVLLGAVDYRLVFSSRDAIERRPRIRLENDHGFEFLVDRAELASHQASFVPCAPRRTASSGFDAFRRAALALARPSVARAGHGSIADPSTTLAPVIERLGESVPRAWSTRSLTPTRYCRVHYVVARSVSAENAFVAGASLAIDYRFRRVGDARFERASLRVGFAHGRLDELERALTEETTTGPRRAVVTIDRALDRLFEGIDPSSDAPRTIERTVLANLLRDTRIDVRLEPL